MVPRDGGIRLPRIDRGQWHDRELDLRTISATTSPATSPTTPNNRLVNVGEVQKIWDVKPDGRRADLARQGVVHLHLPPLGQREDGGRRASTDERPVEPVLTPTRVGLVYDDGHIVSRAGRLAWQIGEKRQARHAITTTRAECRNHWGISATIPPETSAVQVTPTSFVNVTRWTRTQQQPACCSTSASASTTRRLSPSCIEPDVLNGFSDKVWNSRRHSRLSQVYAILDNAATSGRWPGTRPPTTSHAASDLLGFDVMRDRLARVQGRHWRSARQLAVCSRSSRATSRRSPTPAGSEHDRRCACRPIAGTGSKADVGISRPGSLGAGAGDAEPRHALRLVPGATAEGEVLPNAYNAGIKFGMSATMARTTWRAGCVGQGPGLEGPLAARRVRARRVRRRAHRAEGKPGATSRASRSPSQNAINPVTARRPDRRAAMAGTLDSNGLPFDAIGEPAVQRAQPVRHDANVRQEHLDDHDDDRGPLNGWFKRVNSNWETSVALQHLLFGRTSVQGGCFRRSFGNQTFADDLRYGAVGLRLDRSASTRRPMRIFRTAAAIRFADLRPETSRCSRSGRVCQTAWFASRATLWRRRDRLITPGSTRRSSRAAPMARSLDFRFTAGRRTF